MPSMYGRDRHPGSDRAGSGGDSQGSSTAGKRTLVQLRAVQRRSATGPGAPEDASKAAAEGVSGPAGSFPFQGQIEASLGQPLQIHAHTDGKATAACATLGAEAYATGDAVAFSTPSPSLHLAAHEAAHVAQQAGGVSLSSAVGAEGDEHERAADRVADRVVAGQSAAGWLPAALPGRVQLKRPSREVTTGDLLGHAGGASPLDEAKVKDAIAFNNRKWPGAQASRLRQFLMNGPVQDGGFTAAEIEAARRIQLGAGEPDDKADGKIGDTTMAVLLHAGFSFDLDGVHAKASEVELVFYPGEFEDIAEWDKAAEAAIKANPAAPYRALEGLMPSGTGRIYVRHKGNIVHRMDARGGPPLNIMDGGGHSAGPTEAGSHTLAAGAPVITEAWPASQIPWGAPVRKMPDGEWEFQDQHGKWVIATGPNAQLKKKARAKHFEEDNKGRDTWLLNDFGPMAWRAGGTDGQYVHTTPKDEQTVVQGKVPELLTSHGCIHINPTDRDFLTARGFLQGGVKLVVRKYTVHLLPAAMRGMMEAP